MQVVHNTFDGPMTNISAFSMDIKEPSKANDLHGALSAFPHKVVFTPGGGVSNGSVCMAYVSKANDAEAKTIFASNGFKTAAV